MEAEKNLKHYKDFIILAMSPNNSRLEYVYKHYKQGYTKAEKLQPERIIRTRHSWDARGFKTYAEAQSFLRSDIDQRFHLRFEYSIIERTRTLVKS
jgi:hypothetical protein